MSDGTFYVKVRKCKRCGRLLTSEESVEKGYGCKCIEFAGDIEEEREAPIPGQIDIYSFWKEREENG